MVKSSKEKGITLIALVVTIIVLLILASVSISMLLDNNGILNMANKASNETKISSYKEQIQLIKTDLQIKNEDYSLPTIYQLKEALEKEKWVNTLEIIMDKEIEKLKLTTKEGYIFYITQETIEYKGNGQVVDTSELDKIDVIGLEIVKETELGKIVKITDLSNKNYYKMKYQINNGNWNEIESETTIEVPYGGTICAKLFYGSSEGKEHKLSIDNTSPSIVAKDIETSKFVRKTEKSLLDLFETKWGSDGIGKITYEITGNLRFGDEEFSSNEIEDISELELGTYVVKCIMTSPKGTVVEATKEDVRVITLATTEATNLENQLVTAKAIYSEYDLAYFRDLINIEKQLTLNAKLMRTINLESICSSSTKSWTPIGNYNPLEAIKIYGEGDLYYNGVFDGNNNAIDNLYINTSNLYRQGLFGYVYSNGVIKDLTVGGNIAVTGANAQGGICGNLYNGHIDNCTNEVVINGFYHVGGICGVQVSGIISNCKNNANITGDSMVGGICGSSKEESQIERCYNAKKVESTGEEVWDNEILEALTGGITGHSMGVITQCINDGQIKAVSRVNGGIVGRNIGTITYCCNKGSVEGAYVCGGITGNNRGYISYVYNIAEEIKTRENYVGGIAGAQNTLSTSYIQYAYSTSLITGTNTVGGIVGNLTLGTIKNIYNTGSVNGVENVGKICGYIYNASAESNSQNTTEVNMKAWNQTLITEYLGEFVKKNNSLPMLNITVRGILF